MARNEQMEMTTAKGILAWAGGESPLAWAAATGNVKLVEALLRSSRVNINYQLTGRPETNPSHARYFRH